MTQIRTESPSSKPDEIERPRTQRGPLDLTRKDWKRVLVSVWDQIDSDNLSVVAGGVAFWSFLAVFPAIAAIVAIWGLFASVDDVQQILRMLEIPSSAKLLLRERMEALATASTGSLGWGSALALVLALWSANKGTKAIVQALNVAYGTNESRGFIRLNLFTLLLTLLGVVGFILSAVAVIVAPILMGYLGLGDFGELLIFWLRWPVLLVLMLVAMAALFRYAPAGPRVRWQWVSPGSLVGATLWVLGSLGFSLYVEYFASYSEAYGSLGAVVILMMWFYITAFVLLLGAEVNSEAEARAKNSE